MSSSETSFIGGHGDPVAAEKSAFMVGESADGQPSADATQEERADALGDKLKGLYVDMTSWHVAWAIAQRTQTNITSLIKGQ
jgi:hypothetical protein